MFYAQQYSFNIILYSCLLSLLREKKKNIYTFIFTYVITFTGVLFFMWIWITL